MQGKQCHFRNLIKFKNPKFRYSNCIMLIYLSKIKTMGKLINW